MLNNYIWYYLQHKDVQHQWQKQKLQLKCTLFLYKNNSKSEISPVDDDDVQAIGIKYVSNHQKSPFDRETLVLHSG